MERTIQAAVVRADIFLCSALPWLRFIFICLLSAFAAWGIYRFLHFMKKHSK